MSLVGADAGEMPENIEINPDTLLGIEREPEAAPAPVVPEVKKCFAKQRSGTEIIETNIEIPCTN
jgi:hypothetical protein